MELIVFIAIIVYAVSSLSKKAKVQQAQKETRQRVFEQQETVATPEPAKPKAPKAQPMPPMSQMEHTAPRAYQPLEHRMTDVSSRNNDYTGSLGVTSTEGEDLCDPTLEHERAHRSGDVYAIERNAQNVVPITPNAWVQAVVLSEVLKRPNERKWGRH